MNRYYTSEGKLRWSLRSVAMGIFVLGALLLLVAFVQAAYDERISDILLIIAFTAIWFYLVGFVSFTGKEPRIVRAFYS
jgi:hypothetical protein